MIQRACLATASARAAALLFAAALTFGSAAVGPGLAGQDAGLRGSWHARQYTLSDGGTHVVSGQIHFAESDWLVLFFVMDGDAAARGSAEGGRYTLDGDLLTFAGLALQFNAVGFRRASIDLWPLVLACADDMLTLFQEDPHFPLASVTGRSTFEMLGCFQLRHMYSLMEPVSLVHRSTLGMGLPVSASTTVMSTSAARASSILSGLRFTADSTAYLRSRKEMYGVPNLDKTLMR